MPGSNTGGRPSARQPTIPADHELFKNTHLWVRVIVLSVCFKLNYCSRPPLKYIVQ